VFVGKVNRHFPRGMVMIIVISQSKLLQRAGWWMRHTSSEPSLESFLLGGLTF